MKRFCLFAFFGFIMYGCHEKISKDGFAKMEEKPLSTYVNPFIGTGGHGHTYPGATVPYGMLQVSPINGISKWDWCSGYHYSDSVMIGFAHTALSGTGIGDLRDVLFMPANRAYDLAKNFTHRDSIPFRSTYSHAHEQASAGYYQVYLEDARVNAEVTTSLRTASHRYTYSDGDTPSVVVDMGFATNWDKTTASSLVLENDSTLTGYRYSQGWAKNQKVFFVAKFSKPIRHANFFADSTNVKSDAAEGVKTSAQLFFNKDLGTEININVALSSVSIENAKDNLDANQTFEEARLAAETNWNDALGNIVIETPVDSLKTIFYTALYHSQIAPVTFNDANGDFRLPNDSIANSSETTYSTLSLWDTFRAEHPLLTLIAPERVTAMVNSMLTYYDHQGFLPIWTLYANETYTMTGFHSIPVIVDAYQKGIRGFDAEKAYEAMKATMMSDNEKRGLVHYKKYGYLPFDKRDESVTITLEYAFDDWCVAQMAKALGKEEDYTFFMERSKAYRNLFDKSTGFMRGKSSDGKSWHEPFDPKRSSHIVHTDYTEGNAWQHSWFVPHNVEDFITLHGGEAHFTEKLEQLFTESSEITGENASMDITGLIGQYAHGNEPSHHIAYLFNRAGQPWRTQYWVRKILKTQYSAQPDGLSGNEDCGQMSAWYVLSAIGLYPLNPASGEYEIGSPLFEKTMINLPNGKTFSIIAENVSDENIYIQSATLNGKPFNKTTINHQTISNGGVLKFFMGRHVNKDFENSIKK